MACFIKSLFPYAYLVGLWPAFGLLAREVARAKGCKEIKYYLILGPFGYLTALAMPDMKAQSYLKSIARKYSLETEMNSIVDTSNAKLVREVVR